MTLVLGPANGSSPAVERWACRALPVWGILFLLWAGGKECSESVVRGRIMSCLSRFLYDPVWSLRFVTDGTVTPMIRLYNLTQLTLREGHYSRWTDLIRWAIERDGSSWRYRFKAWEAFNVRDLKDGGTMGYIHMMALGANSSQLAESKEGDLSPVINHKDLSLVKSLNWSVLYVVQLSCFHICMVPGNGLFPSKASRWQKLAGALILALMGRERSHAMQNCESQWMFYQATKSVVLRYAAAESEYILGGMGHHGDEGSNLHSDEQRPSSAPCRLGSEPCTGASYLIKFSQPLNTGILIFLYYTREDQSGQCVYS